MKVTCVYKMLISPQTIREEMEMVQPDVDLIHEMGEELVGLCGEPDKPEVEKNVDDLDTNWHDVNSQWATRQKRLDEALSQATLFQEELMVSFYLIGRNKTGFTRFWKSRRNSLFLENQKGFREIAEYLKENAVREISGNFFGHGRCLC